MTVLERIKEIEKISSVPIYTFVPGMFIPGMLENINIQLEQLYEVNRFLLKAFRLKEKMLSEQILWDAYGDEMQAANDFEERMK